MRKYIYGKRYDTEKSKQLAKSGKEELYETNSMKFFLFDKKAERIEVLGYGPAETWARQNLKGEIAEKLFPDLEDSDSSHNIAKVQGYLSTRGQARLRRLCCELETTKSGVLEEAINLLYEKSL